MIFLSILRKQSKVRNQINAIWHNSFIESLFANSLIVLCCFFLSHSFYRFADTRRFDSSNWTIYCNACWQPPPIRRNTRECWRRWWIGIMATIPIWRKIPRKTSTRWGLSSEILHSVAPVYKGFRAHETRMSIRRQIHAHMYSREE